MEQRETFTFQLPSIGTADLLACAQSPQVMEAKKREIRSAVEADPRIQQLDEQRRGSLLANVIAAFERHVLQAVQDVQERLARKAGSAGGQKLN